MCSMHEDDIENDLQNDLQIEVKRASCTISVRQIGGKDNPKVSREMT